MTCESHTNSLLIVNFVNFLSFSQLFSSSENQNEEKKADNLNHADRSTRLLPRVCACFMTQFASQTKKTSLGSRWSMAAFLSYIARWIWKELPILIPQQEKKWHLRDFSTSSAWMKNVTCKAADKLLTGNHVKSSRQLVRKTFTDF